MNDVDKLRLIASFETRVKTWGQWYMCGFGDELPEFYAAERAVASLRRKLTKKIDSVLLDRYEKRLKAYWGVPWVESPVPPPHAVKLRARLIRERKRVLAALGLTAIIPPGPQNPVPPPHAVGRGLRTCHGRTVRRGS
jgi:hypothetical protein